MSLTICLTVFFCCFRSPVDGRLFLAYPHDSGALSQSFDELHLFDDGSSDLVSVSLLFCVRYSLRRFNVCVYNYINLFVSRGLSRTLMPPPLGDSPRSPISSEGLYDHQIPPSTLVALRTTMGPTQLMTNQDLSSSPV